MPKNETTTCKCSNISITIWRCDSCFETQFRQHPEITLPMQWASAFLNAAEKHVAVFTFNIQDSGKNWGWWHIFPFFSNFHMRESHTDLRDSREPPLVKTHSKILGKLVKPWDPQSGNHPPTGKTSTRQGTTAPLHWNDELAGRIPGGWGRPGDVCWIILPSQLFFRNQKSPKITRITTFMWPLNNRDPEDPGFYTKTPVHCPLLS